MKLFRARVINTATGAVRKERFYQSHHPINALKGYWCSQKSGFVNHRLRWEDTRLPASEYHVQVDVADVVDWRPYHRSLEVMRDMIASASKQDLNVWQEALNSLQNQATVKAWRQQK